MAVACSSKGGLPLGFSLHLRAEEAIAKFQREIEDDFNYLHEILAEAKQHFGRRDSNILLPKTPSMKRKRHESDDEQSSDDAGPKTAKEAKAHKTQGYASPLMVINENETLDCSVANEEGKQDGAIRRTRANRGNPQPKRQQPKRGSRKKNAPDVGSSAEDQSSGSSMDEKPRRNTRNSRKKNLELASLVEEKETELTLVNEKQLPKRATRNAGKKYLKETVEVSSAEELPAQPATKKRKSSTATRSKDSGEITVEVVVKQEPASPPEEMPTRRSTRNSRQEKNLVDNDKKETENRVYIPETPEAVVEKVVSPPVSAKTCKATVNLVLQSPDFNIPKANRAASITASPCIEQDHGPHEVRVEENNACPDEGTKSDVVTVSSPTPVLLQESAEACTEMLSENKIELENGEVENEAKSKKNIDAVDGNVDRSNEDVEKENAEEGDSTVKSGRRSTQRNSGWRRKSKRSSFCLSPANKGMSVNMTVTKTKKPGKKSLVKSSVKLKLTQSKLMPELKLGTAEKSSDNQSEDRVEPNLEDVRVRLFDNLTSESSACSASPTSTCTSSSCSSTEDKAEVPVETITEEPTEEGSEEVFHDCISENEADDEADNAKCTAETNSNYSPTVKNSSSPRAAVHTSQGSSGSEESVALLGGISEEPTTPPPPQEAVNPQQKGKPNNIALVHSFIRRNTPKKVDPEEKKKQLRIALKEKEEKEKERREQLEIQKQKEIEERKRRREERAKKAAEQRAAKLQALEEKKRQAEDQRLMMEEKAKKLKEKEEEDKKKQRNQKRAEIEARRKQEEAARLQRKREQEEEEKRQREMLQKKQELEEQERQRKIAEAKRHQEHREKELEKERELEKQRKLKVIEEKDKRLREKEEKERRSREEKQRIERERKAQEEKEREERERARIAQLIREKEEHARREREQRAREEKERQDKERRLKEEREAAVREKKRQEQMEKERRALEERKLAEENKKVESSKNCDSYDMTPPPVKVRKPASNENYNIADLQSDDSTDDEDNPRKKIPSWARPAALKAALFHQEYSNIDVNSIFENVPAPNLEEIFSKCAKKKRFNHRTSSAIWDSPPLRQQVKRGTYV